VYIKPPTTSGHRPIGRKIWIQGTILQRQEIKIHCPAVLCEAVCTVRHTASHRKHVHISNVMLPHHHTDFYIFNKF